MEYHSNPFGTHSDASFLILPLDFINNEIIPLLDFNSMIVLTFMVSKRFVPIANNVDRLSINRAMVSAVTKKSFQIQDVVSKFPSIKEFVIYARSLPSFHVFHLDPSVFPSSLTSLVLPCFNYFGGINGCSTIHMSLEESWWDEQLPNLKSLRLDSLFDNENYDVPTPTLTQILKWISRLPQSLESLTMFFTTQFYLLPGFNPLEVMPKGLTHLTSNLPSDFPNLQYLNQLEYLSFKEPPSIWVTGHLPPIYNTTDLTVFLPSNPRFQTLHIEDRDFNGLAVPKIPSSITDLSILIRDFVIPNVSSDDDQQFSNLMNSKPITNPSYYIQFPPLKRLRVIGGSVLSYMFRFDASTPLESYEHICLDSKDTDKNGYIPSLPIGQTAMVQFEQAKCQLVTFDCLPSKSISSIKIDCLLPFVSGSTKSIQGQEQEAANEESGIQESTNFEVAPRYNNYAVNYYGANYHDYGNFVVDDFTADFVYDFWSEMDWKTHFHFLTSLSCSIPFLIDRLSSLPQSLKLLDIELCPFRSVPSSALKSSSSSINAHPDSHYSGPTLLFITDVHPNDRYSMISQYQGSPQWIWPSNLETLQIDLIRLEENATTRNDVGIIHWDGILTDEELLVEDSNFMRSLPQSLRRLTIKQLKFKNLASFVLKLINHQQHSDNSNEIHIANQKTFFKGHSFLEKCLNFCKIDLQQNFESLRHLDERLLHHYTSFIEKYIFPPHLLVSLHGHFHIGFPTEISHQERLSFLQNVESISTRLHDRSSFKMDYPYELPLILGSEFRTLLAQMTNLKRLTVTQNRDRSLYCLEVIQFELPKSIESIHVRALELNASHDDTVNVSMDKKNSGSIFEPLPHLKFLKIDEKLDWSHSFQRSCHFSHIFANVVDLRVPSIPMEILILLKSIEILEVKYVDTWHYYDGWDMDVDEMYNLLPGEPRNLNPLPTTLTSLKITKTSIKKPVDIILIGAHPNLRSVGISSAIRLQILESFIKTRSFSELIISRTRSSFDFDYADSLDIHDSNMIDSIEDEEDETDLAQQKNKNQLFMSFTCLIYPLLSSINQDVNEDECCTELRRKYDIPENMAIVGSPKPFGPSSDIVTISGASSSAKIGALQQNLRKNMFGFDNIEMSLMASQLKYLDSSIDSITFPLHMVIYGNPFEYLPVHVRKLSIQYLMIRHLKTLQRLEYGKNGVNPLRFDYIFIHTFRCYNSEDYALMKDPTLISNDNVQLMYLDNPDLRTLDDEMNVFESNEHRNFARKLRHPSPRRNEIEFARIVRTWFPNVKEIPKQTSGPIFQRETTYHHGYISQFNQ